MSIVMGHTSQIMTRNLSMDILRTFSWGACISSSQESIEQLSFWKAHLGKLNIKDIFESHKGSKMCTLMRVPHDLQVTKLTLLTVFHMGSGPLRKC